MASFIKGAVTHVCVMKQQRYFLEGIHMNTTPLAHPVASIEDKTAAIIDDLIDSLPDPKQLASEERRGIIARYTSVLEGNFIYWMTAAVIAAKAEQSRPILIENLYEEVHDCHPLMLRKFAIAANAFPTDKDVLGSARRPDQGTPVHGQALAGQVGVDYGILRGLHSKSVCLTWPT